MSSHHKTNYYSALEGLGASPVWQLQRDCSKHEDGGGTCCDHHAAALIQATHGGRDLDGDGTIGGFSPLTTKMDLGGCWCAWVGGFRSDGAG